MPVTPVDILGKKCLGLHMGLDQVSMDLHEEQAISYLTDCENIDITEGFKLARRKGFALGFATSDITSYFEGANHVVFTTATTLYRLDAFSTAVSIRTGLTDAKMYYVNGPQGIYYSNGTEFGIVVSNGLSAVWANGVYYGPPVTTDWSGPFAGTMLYWHKGRMYFVSGKSIIYTEHMSTNLINLEANMITMDTDCTGFAGVNEALFYSSQEKVFSAVGTAMLDKVERIVSSAPAIPGSMINITGTGTYDGKVIWATVDGIYIGADDGSVRNITNDRFKLDWYDGISCYSFCFKDKYYLNVLNTVYVFGIKTEEVTIVKYSNYDFSFFGTYAGALVAAGSGGIYTLLADDDAGTDIDAFAKTPSSDFGIQNQKRNRAVFVSGASSGDLSFTVNPDDCITANEVSYTVKTLEGMRRGVFKKGLNREQKGGRMAYTISNLEGSDFLIDSIKVTVNILHTKPSGLGY